MNHKRIFQNLIFILLPLFSVAQITKIGTPTKNQIAIWDDANSLKGVLSLNYDDNQNILKVRSKIDDQQSIMNGRTVSVFDENELIETSIRAKGLNFYEYNYDYTIELEANLPTTRVSSDKIRKLKIPFVNGNLIASSETPSKNQLSVWNEDGTIKGSTGITHTGNSLKFDTGTNQNVRVSNQSITVGDYRFDQSFTTSINGRGISVFDDNEVLSASFNYNSLNFSDYNTNHYLTIESDIPKVRLDSGNSDIWHKLKFPFTTGRIVVTPENPIKNQVSVWDENGIIKGSEHLTINDSGNIGIGTADANSWKLAVNGKIRAKEIKVETDWSDFVFENDYDLPTLTEVEQHINSKGHLKDIPSANEVQKNGIFLGEMDAKLLQKIEELTLYTIAQDKELKAQKLINKKLEDRLLKLEQLLIDHNK